MVVCSHENFYVCSRHQTVHVPQYNYGYTGILPITTTSTHCTQHYMCVMTLTLLFLLHQWGETVLDVARNENRTGVVAYLEEVGESIVYCG